MPAITADKLLKKDIPPVRYLVEGFIHEEGLCYCFGVAGHFKTNFLLYVAICAAAGRQVLNHFKTQCFKTLWLDEENRERGMKDKISKIAKGMNATDDELKNLKLLISDGFDILNPKNLESLKKEIEEFKPRMIVIDSVAKVFPYDERNEKDVKLIYKSVRPIIEQYKVTIIFIHHARKANFQQYSKNLEDISGSREFGAQADSVFLLAQRNQNLYLLKQTKNRYDTEMDAVNFNVFGDKEKMIITFDATVKSKYLAKAEQIVEALLQWKEKSKLMKFQRKVVLDVMEEKGFKESNILNAVDLLIKQNKMKRCEREFGIYEWT